MNVQAVRTHKITTADNDLFAVLNDYVTTFPEGGVLAITSKIVALCEGAVVPAGSIDKQALIEREAEYFLPPQSSRYHVSLTLKENILIPSAGIDESNGGGDFVLWPRDSQATANRVCAYLRERFARQQVGVVITDSKTTPLRWGVTGVAVAHSGFRALNDYIGHHDLFGRPLRMTRAHVADALSAAAVLVMGEGDEQTPLVVIHDVPFVQFQDCDPSLAELQELHIALEDDLFSPLLRSVDWQRGGGGQ